MTVDEKIEEQQSRLDKIRLWEKRISILRNRKKNPLTEAAFCRKYNLPIASFNKNKNCIRLAKQETVDRVEAALKSEGV